jgi:hypothetical protein
MHRRSQTAQQVAGIVTFFTGMICLFVNTFVTGGMLKVRLFLYVSKWKKIFAQIKFIKHIPFAILYVSLVVAELALLLIFTFFSAPVIYL